MTNTEFAKNILEEINNDTTKLNRDYICNVTELASLQQINEMFGSFAEFKAFVLNGIRSGAFGDGVVAAPTPTQETTDTPTQETTPTQPQQEAPGLEGVGVNPTQPTPAATTKEVYVTNHAGQTKLVRCPAATKLKQILAAVGVDTEEGYDVRVNGVAELDVDSVPENGSRISALKQIKGNC